MHELKNILEDVLIKEVIGSFDLEVDGIAFDSRNVKAKFLFFAICGTQVDGHDYIDKALENGAIAIVCEKLPANIHNCVPYILVEDSKTALSICASNYFNNPSKELKLVGITGTNGKTTTATLSYQLFKNLGFKVGLISTVANYIDDKKCKATHTTPDSFQLNYLIREMVDQGCEYCFVEVSSHAIDQNRISGLTFAGSIFTNITHDHLDYHKTFSAYIMAKKKFFDSLKNNAFALVNVDDKNGKIMVQNTKADIKTYSLKSFSDFKCRIIEKHLDGMLLNIEGVEVWTRFIGEFNAYNILSVYACAILLGQDKEKVLKAISILKTVRGRFEYVRSDSGVISIVDYAHTPDALSNILDAINQIRGGNEQLITVVGAGGNRDKLKRPEMAHISVEKSDKVILTSDNPRFENPQDIINDMITGLDVQEKKNVLSIIDRKEAIRTAYMLAKEGDIILIAGKGHETYQEIEGVKYDFDDKEVLIEIFNND